MSPNKHHEQVTIHLAFRLILCSLQPTQLSRLASQHHTSEYSRAKFGSHGTPLLSSTQPHTHAH